MNINPMQSAHGALRCSAHARTTGKPCQAPAMANGRCRMHGGKSTGAPIGKANGNYKHGRRTQERLREKRELKDMLRTSRKNNRQINGLLREFKQVARDLGVKWSKLWKLCCQNDGGDALLSLIAKRVKKIHEIHISKA